MELIFGGLLGGTALALWALRAPSSGGVNQPEGLPILGDTISSTLHFDSYVRYSGDKIKSNNFQPLAVCLPGKKRMLFVSHPDDLQYVLVDKAANFPKGEVTHERLKELLGEGIFNSDGPAWKEHRKISSHMFSTGQLKHRMEWVFQEHCRVLVDVVEGTLAAAQTAGLDDASLDAQALFNSFTFDSICAIAFGTQVRSLEGDAAGVRFQRVYDRCNAIAAGRNLQPEFLWQTMRKLRLGAEGEMAGGMRILNDYVYDIIRTRKAEIEADPSTLEGSKLDLLSLYFKHGRDKGREFSDEYLRDVVMNFIIAGRDTTAAALTWCLYVLCARAPELEATLLAEIREHAGEGDISFDDAKKMVHVTAFFFETCRLFPPVPIDAKLCVEADTLPSGLAVQPGDEVLYHIYATNRGPAWEDAESFRLDRWMKDGRIVEPETSKYPTFNMMPRLCLGKRMAIFEAVSVLATLLRRFQFRLAKPMPEPVFTMSVTLMAKDGMELIVTPRDPVV